MTDTQSRRATCACRQLAIECVGEPVRVSVCHCLECQKRSGSSFAAQARFPADRVTISGQSRQWTRVGDEGGKGTFDFCPDCGSTVFYRVSADPDLVAVAVGAFAEPGFPAPNYSVYEERKHGWVEIVGEGIDHYG
ncbi:MAG: GFA family protein [Sphingomonas sp.]|uniref:GFA family protein n=1 Tax=Sphingomonas sp. TaxID=28214 RepID=UPI003F7D39C7